LYDIVKTQDRHGALGIVQGERALSRLEHENGHGSGGGSEQGHGSRDQADITPGERPTAKYTDDQGRERRTEETR
ncbi:MAG TPA: hypothetical protein VEY87_06285, partial [Gaiellaceae bacterium]|nr:hypothetical protein [Gaiellaceae bacterium]